MAGHPKPLSEIIFNKFDIDHSGRIDTAEFQQLCFSMGYALLDSELQLVIKVLDQDDSGHIDKKEFTQWWRNADRWNQLKLSEEELVQRQAAADAFNNYDSDKSGVIKSKDFDQFYAELIANKLTSQNKQAALRELDTNEYGKIVFREYISWLSRQGSIKLMIE